MDQQHLSSYFKKRRLSPPDSSSYDDDVCILDDRPGRTASSKRTKTNSTSATNTNVKASGESQVAAQRMARWRRAEDIDMAVFAPSKEKQAKRQALKTRLIGPSNPFREYIHRPTKETIWDAIEHPDDNKNDLNDAKNTYAGNENNGDVDEDLDLQIVPSSHTKQLTDTWKSRFFSHRSTSPPSAKREYRMSRSNTPTGTNTTTKSSKKSKGNSYTPLEEQWLALKKENPGIILAVEVGYKFKFFGEDAKIASKELNVAHFMDHNFFTAMVPSTRLDIHVKRLIAAGHKVGVVRQTESAALKKASSNRNAPFERKLTELYTVSTWVDNLADNDSFFLTTSNSCLLCIREEALGGNGTDARVSISLLAAQIETGVVLWDDFTDGIMRSNLETRLLHLSPSEILTVGDSLSHETKSLISHGFATARLEYLSSCLAKHQAYSRVTSFYSETRESQSDHNPVELLDSVMELPKTVILALAPLIDHLERFSLSSLLRNPLYHFTNRLHMLLNGNTVQNLEIYRNSTDGSERGSLFWILNRTKTKFGRRLLRDWVGRPLTDIDMIKERQNAIDQIKKGNNQCIFKLRDLLQAMPDIERVLSRVLYGRADTREVARLLKALTRISNVFPEGIDPSSEGIASVLLINAIKSFPEIRSKIHFFSRQINMTAAEESRKQDLFNDQSSMAFEEIQDCRDSEAVVAFEIDQALQDARRLLGKPSLGFATIGNEEYLFVLSNTEAQKVPQNWIRISATKDKKRYRSPQLQDLLNQKTLIDERLEAENAAAFKIFLQSIAQEYASIRQVIQNLAVVDCLFSLSEVALFPGYSKPLLSHEPKFDAVQARHPMIEQLLDAPFVPNDIKMEQSGIRAMVLTGMNAGGKSSLAKTVALICIMSQIGCHVPAEMAHIGVFDAIFTRMGASDDLIRGRSTFMVELFETCEILKAASCKSFVILDELGRGTSTHDGVSIAVAVVEYLVRQTKAVTIAITHYPQLSEIAMQYSQQVKSCHMDFIEKKQPGSIPDVTFLYKLKDGIARSHGISVAKMAGLSEHVLSKAMVKSNDMELKMWNKPKYIRSRKFGNLLKLLQAKYHNHEKEDCCRLAASLL